MSLTKTIINQLNQSHKREQLKKICIIHDSLTRRN